MYYYIDPDDDEHPIRVQFYLNRHVNGYERVSDEDCEEISKRLDAANLNPGTSHENCYDYEDSTKAGLRSDFKKAGFKPCKMYWDRDE
jgi:hypothetical protein